MSDPREKVDISDLKDTFLECPVCVEHFNQTDRRPRLLHSCLHAFCTQCLQQLLEKEGSLQITCPLCRQVQKVTGKADVLPLDPVRGKLVDYVHMKHQKKVPCTDCPDGSDADTRCQECSLYLCKECSYVHKRHRFTNDHLLIPLDNVPEQSVKSLSKAHFCSLHPKHHLEFYCMPDESLCCLSCHVLDHQGHTFQKVEEAVKPKQQELEAKLQDIKSQAGNLMDRRRKEEQRQVVIQQEREGSKADVSKQFTQLERMVRNRKIAILTEIDHRSSVLLSSSKKNLDALDQSLALFESTENYYNQAKVNSDAVEMLQMYPALKRSLDASTFQTASQETITDNIHVEFVPSFVSVMEKILPETGCVLDVSGASSADKETKKELTRMLNDIITMTLLSKSKEELLAKLTEGTKIPCSNCQTLMDKPKNIKCKHLLCVQCFDKIFKPTEVCPVCKTNCKVITGYMPPGTMRTETLSQSLPGYEKFGTIKISYQIEDGIQSENHPSPGECFRGSRKSAYLPNSPEGQKVLAMLKVAWERRLTFELRRHLFDFMNVWHGGRGKSFSVYFHVPHLTNTAGGPVNNGYPDSTYLQRVKEKLASLGITEYDIPM